MAVAIDVIPDSDSDVAEIVDVVEMVDSYLTGIQQAVWRIASMVKMSSSGRPLIRFRPGSWDLPGFAFIANHTPNAGSV